MKAPVSLVGMLREVEGIERFESLVFGHEKEINY